MVCQLLKESGVGPYRPRLSNVLQRLSRGHVLLHHEVGGHHGGRAGPTHHAVDHHEAVSIQGLVDEVRGAAEEPRDVRHGVVVHVEPEVRDAVQRVLGGVHRHVALSGVEHVGHADAFQVLHVLDGLSVAQDDTRVDLKHLFLCIYVFHTFSANSSRQKNSLCQIYSRNCPI